MTVTSNPQNGTTRTGNIHLAPIFDFGSFFASVTATSNGQSDTRSFVITVSQFGRGPVVTAPATATVPEAALLVVNVTATDPDGEAITNLTATGTAIAAGATFVKNASNTSGTLTWTPSFTQAGSYAVTFTASNTLSGSATTDITVMGVDRAPVVTAPASVTGSTTIPMTFTVSAADPDGDAILSLTASGVPLGATFASNVAHTSGTFNWTPDPSQAGNYTVTFTVSNALSRSAATAIYVSPGVDRPPVADPGPDGTGVVGVPVDFDGSGSFDPDGDPLAYAWDFGDGSTGSGVTVSHGYSAIDTYTVTLTVTSNGLSDSGTATMTIIEAYSATAFTTGGNGTVSLNSGKPYLCVQIQPGGGYENSQVNLSRLRMQYTGGSVPEIFADASKSAVEADKNHDGVTEITACFRKEDLRLLFSGLPQGTNNVNVDIRGDLVTGGGFHATLSLVVKSTGGALAASIAPNPLNPRAKLTFATTRPGAARVQIFGPQGRLVRTVVDQVMPAGYHDVDIEGRSAIGSKLASGVYLVTIWTQYDGEETKRITVLK
jgi:hypothetical protein